MKSQGVTWLRGVVVVHARGGRPEELVNQALGGGLSLSAIRWTSNDTLQFELSVGDFFKIRPYLRKTGCRIHVVKRNGLPFWMARAEKRMWFAGGLALFFAIIFLLSSLVWKIEVEGNTRISNEQILEAAKSEGLFTLQWSFRLQNTDVLSKKLVTALPGTTWVGVEKKGTKVRIQVVEMSLPELASLNNPRHLVASANAVVTQIVAEAGKPLVRKNTRVQKGQTLISGIIGNENYSKTVVAKGTVRGLVWYEYEVEAPMTQQTKVYTGEKKTKWFAVIGNRALQLSGFGDNPFGQSESVTREERVSWRDWTLPFGRMKETILESEMQERTLTEEEAKAVGIMQARAEVMEKAGMDALIQDEIVLHEKADNGKVYMKVLFEVEQSIAEELPLVQMQGD
ncbi:sporulation protein YqfD [Paenibacillus sp. strain BS8-2]